MHINLFIPCYVLKTSGSLFVMCGLKCWVMLLVIVNGINMLNSSPKVESS